jgi:hypothetical protein
MTVGPFSPSLSPIELHSFRDFLSARVVHRFSPSRGWAGSRWFGRNPVHRLERFNDPLQAVSFLYQVADNPIQVHVSPEAPQFVI